MPGHRKRRRRAGPGAPEINVGPFSDIAFLLIIFFIVATTLSRSAGFVAEIPAGETSDEAQDETPTVQLVDARILFQQEEVTLPELRRMLADLDLPSLPTPEARIVLLETAGAVIYQTYFEAMAAISQAGGVIAIAREE